MIRRACIEGDLAHAKLTGHIRALRIIARKPCNVVVIVSINRWKKKADIALRMVNERVSTHHWN